MPEHFRRKTTASTATWLFPRTRRKRLAVRLRPGDARAADTAIKAASQTRFVATLSTPPREFARLPKGYRPSDISFRIRQRPWPRSLDERLKPQQTLRESNSPRFTRLPYSVTVPHVACCATTSSICSHFDRLCLHKACAVCLGWWMGTRKISGQKDDSGWRKAEAGEQGRGAGCLFCVLRRSALSYAG